MVTTLEPNPISYSYEKREVVLQMQNISLTLGHKRILRDINLNVRNIVRPGVKQGQVIAVLAPSGTGKTKLFEIISGILPPSSGTVEFLDHSQLEPVKLGRVGVVQQDYPLFHHRTVRSNLCVAARTPAAREKVDFYLDRFGLRAHAGQYPGQLSGGQRQRVAIAQQLLSSGHLLLMDEPFSGLDVNMMDEVQRVITEVSLLDELNTILLISHDIHACASVADSIWLLGQEKDANGNRIPGATILKQYCLIERGLAWRNRDDHPAAFSALKAEIRADFTQLR